MNLLYNHKNLKKTYETFNKELSILNDWFRVNRLTVNVSKTKYIIFGSLQKLRYTITEDIRQRNYF